MNKNLPLLQFLNDNGVTKINGLPTLSFPLNQKISSLSFNHKKLPSLSFILSSQDFVAFYQAPDNFGQQSFSFSYDSFILSFNQAKFKHSTPKKDYISFTDYFFFLNNYSPNDYLLLLFSCFSITPTILKSAIHQNKKLKKRIKLFPKISSLNKFVGL